MRITQMEEAKLRSSLAIHLMDKFVSAPWDNRWACLPWTDWESSVVSLAFRSWVLLLLLLLALDCDCFLFDASGRPLSLDACGTIERVSNFLDGCFHSSDLLCMHVGTRWYLSFCCLQAPPSHCNFHTTLPKHPDSHPYVWSLEALEKEFQ